MKRESGSMSNVRGFSLLLGAAYNRFPSIPRFLRSVGWRLEARLGVGKLWGRYDDVQAAGTSIPAGFSMGWRPARHLVLFGEITNVRMRTANVRNEPGVESADLLGAGAGLKYCLTPSRWFVSLALLRAWLSYHDQDRDWIEHRQEGFSGRLAMGKEWWLSRHWSLGLAGEVVRGELRPRRDASYATSGVSLLALASYDFAAREDLESASAPPTTESAPPPAAPEPGRHTHDGFFVGVRHGVGWLTLRRDRSLSGRGWPLALSAGHAVARNLIVFGEFYDMQTTRFPLRHEQHLWVELRGPIRPRQRVVGLEQLGDWHRRRSDAGPAATGQLRRVHDRGILASDLGKLQLTSDLAFVAGSAPCDGRPAVVPRETGAHRS